MGRNPKPAEVRAVFLHRAGERGTLKQAAAAAGVSRTTSKNWVKQTGGVRPHSTRPRQALRLSIEERETISRGLTRKLTLTAIAAELGRSVSTPSTEVRRNSGPNGYRAARAERLAMQRTAQSRPGKLADDPVLRGYVEDKLAMSWSPRQISRRLAADFPDDAPMRVSYETIYTSLFVQSKAVLSTELTGRLRTRRIRRRPHRRVSVGGQRRIRIPDLRPISERPVEVLDRAQPGHSEATFWLAATGAAI